MLCQSWGVQKRVLPLLLAATVAAALSACGDANQSAGPDVQQVNGVECAYPPEGVTRH